LKKAPDENKKHVTMFECFMNEKNERKLPENRTLFVDSTHLHRALKIFSPNVRIFLGAVKMKSKQF